MAHTLIIGPPGAGKTYIAEIMRERNLPAYDGDHIPQLTHWTDKSGAVVTWTEDVTKDWYNDHSFVWNTNILKRFLEKRPKVFIFGVCDNIFDMIPFFDRTWYLHIPVTEIPRRLTSKHRENPFGHLKKEQKIVTDWIPFLDKKAREYNLQFIDATLSPQKITEILTQE